MVAIGNDTLDEMAPRLGRFMEAVGAGGDIPARVREALESPDGIGAQIAAVLCEVATMLATRLTIPTVTCWSTSPCSQTRRTLNRASFRGENGN
jgi:hypothetical protein